MDPDKLEAINEWYEDQKAAIEKVYLDHARKNPLDQKAKAHYRKMLHVAHEKYEKLAIKEITSKHELQKNIKKFQKELEGLMDKLVEIYKE